MMGVFNQLAIAFQYPTTKSFEQLENNMEEFADGPIKSSYVLFWNKIRNLSLSQFEELYTRTLDLNPSAAPYIGFQIWGESYQRGEFLALMNHALRNAEVDLHGELSDHLLPVLNYLETSNNPVPELIEVLQPAVTRMQMVLRKGQEDNPYVQLFEAVLEAIKSLPIIQTS
jgi:nitrate reductase delta subunit